jgi:hypothetical protein
MLRFISFVFTLKGAIFAALAVAVLIVDWMMGDGFMLRSFGEHVTDIGISLEALQAGVQRYLDPDLWDDYIVPVLLTPSLYIFGGVALLALGFGWLIKPNAYI